MINIVQFRELILRPTLVALTIWKPELEEILVGTMAHESKFGTFLKQIDGPALGLYGMEPNTHEDIWNHFLNHESKLLYLLLPYCGLSYKPKPETLVYHVTYSTAMAAFQYNRHKEPIPKDLESMALFYKKYYNTSIGKATPQQFIDDYLILTGEKKGVSNERKNEGKIQREGQGKEGKG